MEHRSQTIHPISASLELFQSTKEVLDPLAQQKGIDAFAAIRLVSDNMNGSSVVVFQRALN
jgi:hypothetical protein